MTKGMKSSEFWVSMAVIAATALLAMQGVITGEHAMYLIGGVASAYGLSRGHAKNGNGKED